SRQRKAPEKSRTSPRALRWRDGPGSTLRTTVQDSRRSYLARTSSRLGSGQRARGSCTLSLMARDPFVGKIVWITGASSGIGRSLALAFARAGASLILSAREQRTLEPVRAACGAV